MSNSPERRLRREEKKKAIGREVMSAMHSAMCNAQYLRLRIRNQVPDVEGELTIKELDEVLKSIDDTLDGALKKGGWKQ